MYQTYKHSNPDWLVTREYPAKITAQSNRGRESKSIDIAIVGVGNGQRSHVTLIETKARYTTGIMKDSEWYGQRGLLNGILFDFKKCESFMKEYCLEEKPSIFEVVFVAKIGKHHTYPPTDEEAFRKYFGIVSHLFNHGDRNMKKGFHIDFKNKRKPYLFDLDRCNERIREHFPEPQYCVKRVEIEESNQHIAFDMTLQVECWVIQKK